MKMSNRYLKNQIDLWIKSTIVFLSTSVIACAYINKRSGAVLCTIFKLQSRKCQKNKVPVIKENAITKQS